MDIPGDSRNNYIARMEWAGNPNELVIEQLNRLQNTADLLIAESSTGKTRRIFRDQDKAWVDVNEIRAFGQPFVWLSERDGWRHAYLVHSDQSEVTLLTPGQFEVIGIDGVSKTQHAIYFTASPGNATQSYLYRTGISADSALPVRITPPSEPGFHSYAVSPSGEWAFHRFSRFDDPGRFELVRLADAQATHTFADNAEQRKKLTYGEPAALTVVDRWSGNTGRFHRALAQDGYVVVSFDNRGTPAPKGCDWRKIVSGSVGPVAAEEQTIAINKLCAERAYLDVNRVAVWGWSGGATDTLNLMFRSPDTYRVGLAVAPVPDQRLYDTIYQERYMGLPQDSSDGYKRGSAINFASALKGHLLLVHGTGDDNVHFQGSQILINKLIECGKQFTLMEYPNSTHAISEGQGTTIHLFTLLASYLEENLPPTSIGQ